MTSKDLKDHILSALSAVKTQDGNALSLDRISGLDVSDGGDVFFVMEVRPDQDGDIERLRMDAESAVRGVPGVHSANAIMTAEREASVESSPASSAPDPHGMNKNPRLTLPFKHVIAVGSGKGGVGKSTVAFNLAVALSELGLDVALLDADIYGPSVPRLTGLAGQKPVTNDAGKIIPLSAHGLNLMSMGFLVDEEKPMIWRGPMVQTAFYQMLRDVAWQNENNACDVLVIDMPPGTGDVQLTLAQKVPVTGAVIVSTPQDLALIDAKKAIAMFEKTDVKVLGLIENMSTYVCSNCGHEDHIFGHGGAADEALRRGVSFLGEIPLSAHIRKLSDDGQPVPDDCYKNIAKTLMQSLVS